MSAPATAILPPDTIYTGIKDNWVRTRPSILKALYSSLEYAELKFLGVVIDLTVGHSRTWAKAGWTLFEKVSNCTRRRCEQAQAALLKDGIMRYRKSVAGNGYEYAMALRPDSEEAGIAKCRGCGVVGEIDLDQEFIPIPHSFFINLPRSCDHGMYLVVACIVERTMRWDRVTKQIIVIPCEITIEEFERATRKKRSEILQDLQKVQAEGYGFIGSEKTGRTNRYWAKPENFASAPARAAREVKQPKERKKRETTPVPNPVQPLESPKSIRPVEFVTVPCGVCRNCQCYGPVDIVSESQVSPRKPLERARSAPVDRKSRSDQFWEGVKAGFHAG